jgi:hypothetical protein
MKTEVPILSSALSKDDKLGSRLTNSEEKISPVEYSPRDPSIDVFFLNVIPTDGQTATFRNFTPSGGQDKPSKPSRSSIELGDSFKEIGKRDFTIGGRARSKTKCSIDVDNDHGKLANEDKYLGSASSQSGSKSRKNKDFRKTSRGENKVPPVGQLKRSQSVLVEEPNSNYRPTDLFGNKMSSFVQQTFAVNTMVGTVCVVEESAEDLRCKSQSDHPKFNGSESPDKIPGSESRNFSTEFIYTSELAGPPTLKTKHHPETEDMSHSQEIIVESRPKKRSVNSDTMMLPNPFKKLVKNDTYFSQKNDTPPSRQLTIFPTPSWTAFGSNPNHSSS